MAGRLTERQQEARVAILRDVEQSGGTDRWSHLHSHGHHYSQVTACVRRGDLQEIGGAYLYSMTPAGRLALSEGKEAGNGQN